MPDSRWVALSLVRHLGGKTFLALMAHFNHDLSAILNADATQLRAVPGVGPRIAESIAAVNVPTIEKSLKRWNEAGVTALARTDAAYPVHLRGDGLADAPPTLFTRGNWPDWRSKRGYAVVGTRRASSLVQSRAERLGFMLAHAGHIVISGLAEGVDTGAHMGALAADGVTVAVLGSGVLNVYPPSNRSLAAAIIQRGALACEVAPNANVSASGLVARNRIITGLSEAVFIVETDIDGGAMHAARFARMQGRPVYALDGDAAGNRQLIADGAIPVSPDFDALPPELLQP